MKFRVILFGIICLCTLQLAVAGVLENFGTPSTWHVNQGEVNGGGFAYAEPPDGSSLAGKCTWDTTHAGFIEYYLNSPRAIQELKDGLSGVITLKVYCEANIPIRSVNLRLTDAHGEVFQWNNAVKSAEAGWQELSYPLTRDTVAAHWGGDTNHTLDFPVSLQGFALVFAPKVAGSGVLYIDDIAYMNSIIPDTGVRQLAQSQLMHFDGNESWRIYTKETGVTTETTDHGLVCTIPPADADGTVSLADASNAGKRALDHPVTLTLHAELLSGTNTELSVRFRDGQGETHQLRLCRLQPGMNTMTWHMPDDIVANWGTNKNGVMESPVLVQEIFLLRHAGKEPVKIRFADSMIQEMRPTLACVTADVETGNPIHVLKVGEEKSLGLRLTNSALTTLTCRLRVQLEGFYGETITDEKDVKLAPQGDTIVPLPIPKKLGIWWLNYTLQDPAGDATVTGRRSFCYMQPAGPTPGFSKGFLLGVCSHPERWGLADQEREALAATLCGAKTLRSEFNRWQGTQPTPDRWDFTVFDRLVDMYGKQGIEVQYLFLGLANWAQRPEKGSVPADMTTWARYVSTVAKRYQGRIRYWEIWNEPDLGFKGTNEEYLSMLRTAYHEIKAVDPKMQVLTAGFATLRWGAHPDLVDYVTQHGTQDFDILAMHVHGNFQHYRKTVDGPLAEVRSAMKPPKPLFFNETAMTVYNGDGEQGQAETLVKKVVYARACGAMGYQWYDLRNDGFDPMNGEHNYGLITHDFYPKAVYAAFNTLALHIRDKHYLAALPVGAGRNAYVFDDADEQIVVTWNDEVNASDGNMILATDAAQAYRMDLMGNTTPTPITNGRVVLPITAQPMYLVLAKAKRTPTVQGALAVVTGLRPSAPGDSRHVTVTLVNPFNKPDTAEVTWMLPNELHTAPVIQQVNLAANGKAATSLEMVIPANLTVKAGDTLYMRMKYVFKQTGWTGTIVAPVPMAVYVPTTPQPRDADFILESRQHVVNLFENNPATAQLTWQGTQDLSARVWLGHTAQAMTMHIVVHDDTFVPSPDTKSIFRGDSVQLQLRIPGQVGYWDAGFARLADGTPGVLIVRPPKGMADPTTQIKVSTSAQEKTIVYDIELPYAAFGLSDAILETGIQFNLLIYDNDGKEREGWLQISPGSIEVPELSPFVVYAPK